MLLRTECAPGATMCEPSLAGRNLVVLFSGMLGGTRRDSGSGPGLPAQGGLQGTRHSQISAGMLRINDALTSQ